MIKNLPKPNPLQPGRLAFLLEKARIKREQELAMQAGISSGNIQEIPTLPEGSESPESIQSQSLGMHGEVIAYNASQQRFIDVATSGSSCILIGAAGTGKTTSMRGTAQALIQSGKLPIFRNVVHKHLPASGVPGIIFCAYTRRATANIRKALPADLKANCVTIHKLLEYGPVFYEGEYDPVTGRNKTTMRFEPARHAGNPLPSEIQTIVVEESSMVSVELFAMLQDACPHPVQFIFLGDVQQLPPVFGPAILGYKLLEYSYVELTEVYRQALESPIIRLAHRILSGAPIQPEEFDTPEWKIPGKLTIHPWKKQIADDMAAMTFSLFMSKMLDSGNYDPEQDTILVPFNKGCGSIEINARLAGHIARKADREVYEVIAGFNKYYYSVGDKVLYDKEDAIIVSITPNATYTGKTPKPASKTMDYFGIQQDHSKAKESHDETLSDEAIEFLLSQAHIQDGEVEERVSLGSHTIRIRRAESDVEIDVSTAAALNTMSLGYAITVHKSQGSEWRKVFICFHKSHATMLQRELLYTAVTRAREELYVICEPNTFVKGILSQKIPGNTLESKIEYFKGKPMNQEF